MADFASQPGVNNTLWNKLGVQAQQVPLGAHAASSPSVLASASSNSVVAKNLDLRDRPFNGGIALRVDQLFFRGHAGAGLPLEFCNHRRLA